jgi:hypothetical protein
MPAAWRKLGAAYMRQRRAEDWINPVPYAFETFGPPPGYEPGQ